jgi:hypothetical protein
MLFNFFTHFRSFRSKPVQKILMIKSLAGLTVSLQRFPETGIDRWELVVLCPWFDRQAVFLHCDLYFGHVDLLRVHFLIKVADTVAGFEPAYSDLLRALLSYATQCPSYSCGNRILEDATDEDIDLARCLAFDRFQKGISVRTGTVDLQDTVVTNPHISVRLDFKVGLEAELLVLFRTEVLLFDFG